MITDMLLGTIIQGDCIEVMKTFPDEFIDCIITSPPYWGLRDYGLGKLQLGMESHPQQYIDNLVNVCKEIKRILKPSGSFWFNLGDTYCGGGKNKPPQSKWQTNTAYVSSPPNTLVEMDGRWLQPKQLLGIPWRVTATLQEDSWILRNCVIWEKRNAMPESMKDRLSRKYEFIFFFVKSNKYYFDLDSIRVPHLTNATKKKWDRSSESYNESYEGGRFSKGIRTEGHSKGKNPGDVWDIPTASFRGAHFAVFPPKLIEPIIKSACPEKGIVLDPFCGSGTACVVAKQLGRDFIGIELNQEYIDICEERLKSAERSI